MGMGARGNHDIRNMDYGGGDVPHDEEQKVSRWLAWMQARPATIRTKLWTRDFAMGNL